MSDDIRIVEVDPQDSHVLPLIAAHLKHSADSAPPTSCHAMSADQMAETGVRFWVLNKGEEALACGALKPLGDGLVEVKSVHVLEKARGQGLSRPIMAHVIEVARADGFSYMVLETGSTKLAEYDAARGLYERLGFTYRGPFGDYSDDPLSTYMSLDLRPR